MDAFLVALALYCPEGLLNELVQIEELLIEFEVQSLQLGKVHEVIDQCQQHIRLVMAVF